jgi:hypothetical protein
MMSMQVFIAVSVDCERISAESTHQNSTASWDMSERATIGLAEPLC